MADTFSAIVITVIYCANGQAIVAGGKCEDGSVPRQVSMEIMNGEGICPDWECADGVSSLFRVKRDDEVLVDIPAAAVDREAIKLMWGQLQDMIKERQRAEEAMRRVFELQQKQK